MVLCIYEARESGLFVYKKTKEETVRTVTMRALPSINQDTVSVTLLFPNNTNMEISGDPNVIRQVIDRIAGMNVEYLPDQVE